MESYVASKGIFAREQRFVSSVAAFAIVDVDVWSRLQEWALGRDPNKAA